MRPELRLAISTALARRSRTLLLIIAVALSAAMIAGVACAMASVTRGVSARLDEAVGRAEVRITPVGSGKYLTTEDLEAARAWPESALAVGRSTASIGIAFRRPFVLESPNKPRERVRIECLGTATAFGIDPGLEPRIRGINLVAGRLPEAPDEIAVDEGLVRGFTNPQRGAYRVLRGEDPADGPEQPGLGTEVFIVRLLRSPIPLQIVGVTAQPPFGTRWQCHLTLEGLARITGQNRLSEIDVVLRDGTSPTEVVDRHRERFGSRALVQTTARITSDLDTNVRGAELGFVLATVMAFLSASFIIATGLSTGVTERERELALLRCIGATRGQLAAVQLTIGAMIGGAGAAVGIPLGIALAFALAANFTKELPTGAVVSLFGVWMALAGSIGAGLLGAAYPAWRASRASPLEGLSVRSVPPGRGMILRLLTIGLCLLALQVAITFGPRDGQVAFWSYATVGLPGMFIGYFLLGVPVLLLVEWSAGPAVNTLLGLPRNMLSRTIRATPFRYGFTASAMMSGLAIMVAIWTQGRSIVQDWLAKFEFPDAFVMGLNLTESALDKLNAMPFVTGTCAVTLQPIEQDAFGVRAIQRYKSMFMAFEPDSFFRMNRITWIEPTTPEGQAEAQRRLGEGGAILVAKEFQIANGVRVGDSFRARSGSIEHDFEIVGVVTSPGLEIVSKFFQVGESFTDQAIHAVFGSRKDLKEVFRSEAINLIQIGLDPGHDDGEALAMIRTGLLDAGLLDAGSGRQVKEQIRELIGGGLVIASSVAVFAMLVAGFGVANIIIAGVQSRRFEFGVLRSIGATRGLLIRLILAEAVLIALTAVLLGTALGVQGIASGQRLDRLLFGLELSVRPPLVPIAVGWLFIFAVTLGAALPTALSSAKRSPRELLSTMRG